MKKAAKIIATLAAVAAFCIVIVELLRCEKVQAWLHNGKNEDLTLKVEEKLRLVGDLLMWPVNYVKGLLP